MRFTKKAKKAQVSMFMIFGVILLFLTGFIIYGFSTRDTSASSTSGNPVENYVKECAKTAGGYAIYLLGIRGGKIYDVSDSFVKDYYNVTYGYDGVKTLPSLSDARRDVERYIDENLNSGAYSCVKDLAVFNDQYDKITVGDVRSEVVFAEENTIIRINMSVSLQKKDAVKTYDSFSDVLDVRYKKIHDFASSMLDSRDAVPLSKNGGVDVRLIPFIDDDVELYALTDQKSRLGNKDYVFLTAVRGVRSAGVCS